MPRIVAKALAVPPTRPLLRQIESLHANFTEKTRVWEQVELSLRQRCEVAEREARAAAEKERAALQVRLERMAEENAFLKKQLLAQGRVPLPTQHRRTRPGRQARGSRASPRCCRR